MTRSGNIPINRSAPATASRSLRMLEGPREVVIPRLILVVTVFVLVMFGLVMVYSSSFVEAIDEGNDPAYYLWHQVAYALVGLVLCVLVVRVVPYRWLSNEMLYVFMGICIVLLLLTAAIGTVGLGAQRWLVIGPVSFQPSEFAKVGIILMSARVMCRMRDDEVDVRHAWIEAGIGIVLPLLLIFASQSDLGTTLICVIGIVTVLWMGDLPVMWFVVIFVAGVAFCLYATFGTGYRSDRMIFLDPFSDYYGSGYQLIRSFYAFADGGLFGVGLGNSTEKYLYLPESETDFIYAIIGEEFGLVGAVAVIVAFLLILYAGLKIARQAPDAFGRMAAAGCTVMLVSQAFINIGCVIGLMPTTGKPLPFISAGGSSLMGSMLLVGVILAVSFAQGDDSAVYRARRENLKVVRAADGRRAPQMATSHGARRSNASRSAGRQAYDGRRKNSTGRSKGRNRP